VDRCAGLPLAVRIVGARLAARPHWRISRLAERMGDERHRLAEAAKSNLEWLSAAQMADRMLAVYDAVRQPATAGSVDMVGARVRHFARHPLRSAVRLGTHALVRRQTDGRVVAGPFAGMWYGLPVPHLPAYLGTYELELRPLLAELAGTPFDLVLNVGAADGYYAAGLAALCPAASVVAFEMTPAKQANARRVVAENGIAERVRIEGECTPARLNELVQGAGRPLVWMDVDGAELDLLDPERVPELRRAEVVVELHPFLVPRPLETLEQRFASTHEARLVRGQGRRAEQFPLGGRLWQTPPGRAVAVQAMQERRPEPQDWLHLRPRDVTPR